MKKISVLSLTALSIVLTLVMVYTESTAQTSARAKEDIVQSNKNFMEWFNHGQIDSITSLYADNACLEGRGCGKDFIKEYYTAETAQYKFQELITSNVTVKDNVAIETGRWKLQLSNGTFLSGNYSSEWRYLNKKWVIVKEASPTTDH